MGRSLYNPRHLARPMNRPRAARIVVALVVLASACAKKDDAAKAAATPSNTAAVQPKAPAAEPPQAPKAEPPPQRSPEELLRAEVKKWTGTPYVENGTSRSGVGNPGFVRALLHGALGIDVPATHDDQLRNGKLVTRDALAPGDLVFFEGQGFGPFRSKSVGVFVGNDQVAIAQKDVGVGVVRLSEARWSSSFKTARRATDPNAAAPTFNAANYGSREALLRDVAKAWSGTLYRQGGTTFDGIGNDEFVREIYGAIYDTELEGTPSGWVKMGHPVSRDALEPGDIILYEAVGIGKLVNQHHAGMYIGEGEFVHSVKGSAVTISKMNDPRWSAAFRAARRIDPVALTRSQEARVETVHRTTEPKAHAATAPRTAENTKAGGGGAAASAVPPHAASDSELRLRQATEAWRGTPYKLGGETKAGVDCSAFVRAIYKDVFGFELPRSAEEQERLGAKVDRGRLETGDLVFFRTQGMGPLFKSRHVGLYLGGGEFAQSSGSKGVTVTRLDNYYWNKKYEGARRVQNAAPGTAPEIAGDPDPRQRALKPLLPNHGPR